MISTRMLSLFLLCRSAIRISLLVLATLMLAGEDQKDEDTGLKARWMIVEHIGIQNMRIPVLILGDSAADHPEIAEALKKANTYAGKGPDSIDSYFVQVTAEEFRLMQKDALSLPPEKLSHKGLTGAVGEFKLSLVGAKQIVTYHVNRDDFVKLATGMREGAVTERLRAALTDRLDRLAEIEAAVTGR